MCSVDLWMVLPWGLRYIIKAVFFRGAPFTASEFGQSSENGGAYIEKNKQTLIISITFSDHHKHKGSLLAVGSIGTVLIDMSLFICLF